MNDGDQLPLRPEGRSARCGKHREMVRILSARWYQSVNFQCSERRISVTWRVKHEPCGRKWTSRIADAFLQESLPFVIFFRRQESMGDGPKQHAKHRPRKQASGTITVCSILHRSFSCLHLIALEFTMSP